MKKENNLDLGGYIIIIFSIAVLCSLAFLHYKQHMKSKSKIYYFDQERILKMVSLDAALKNPDSKKALKDPSLLDKEYVYSKIQALKTVLREDYKNSPLLVTPPNKHKVPQGYYIIYSDSTKVDITDDLIEKLIGEERWDAVRISGLSK